MGQPATIKEKAEKLALHTTGWVVIAGFAYRILLVPASLLAGWSFVVSSRMVLVPLATVLVACNVVLAVSVARRRLTSLLSSRAFFWADVGLTAALNLWATAILPSGALLETGSDIFWWYTLGTIWVWTCVRGATVGATLVASGAIIQILMIAENHAAISTHGLLQLLGRIGWLAAGCLVPWVILRSATQGARIAVAGSLIKGRDIERGRVFGDLHDIVLQALGEIARQTVTPTSDAQQTLSKVRMFAESQANNILNEFSTSNPIEMDLGISVRAVCDDFTRRGLTVGLDLPETGYEPAGPARAALTGALREGLNNVLQHSGSTSANVSLCVIDTTVCLVVEDEGKGFDPNTVEYRIGIRSIEERMRTAGGRASVATQPGVGTTVLLEAPIEVYHRRPDRRLTKRSPESFGVDSLEAESLGWFAIPALVYRACLTPLQTIIALATLPINIPASLWIGMSLVWVFDVALLVIASHGRRAAIFKSPLLFVADVLVTTSINFWSVLTLPAGTALIPGNEFLWVYMYGTVILWTAIRGPIVGLGVVFIGLALQIIMASVNLVPWTGQTVLALAAQSIKLTTALIMSWIIANLARQGFRLAVEGGREVGAEHARAEGLRALCDGAVDNLQTIAHMCLPGDSQPASERIRRVRGASLQHLASLRRQLAMLTTPEPPVVQTFPEIFEMIDEFRRLGLRVEFVRTGEPLDASNRVTEFMYAELHSALSNVLEHSGASHVVVRMEVRDRSAEIVVRDHGVGFSPPHEGAISEAVPAPQNDDGKKCFVRTWSRPGEGTRVQIDVEW